MSNAGLGSESSVTADIPFKVVERGLGVSRNLVFDCTPELGTTSQWTFKENNPEVADLLIPRYAKQPMRRMIGRTLLDVATRLEAGEVIGDGDVRLARPVDPVYRRWLHMFLTSPEGESNLLLPSDDLWFFLQESAELVPPDAENNIYTNQVDAALSRLLGDDPQAA